MPRPLTRRALVGSAAAAGAAAGYDLLAGGAPAAAADLSLYLGPALEPELVTVTDTAFVAWWWTEDAADTTVHLTPVGGPEDGRTRILRLEEGQHVHVARVDGLRPGQRYRYELYSGGRRVSLGQGEADPGSFRTLVPPAGRHLATIAVLNDLHVGEHCSGTVTDALGPSIPPCFSSDAYPDYAHRMVSAAIDELSRLDLDLVIANGDLTDRGRPDEVSRALAQLHRLDAPLQVTRGNHDRRLAGACATDGDCLRQQAFPGQRVGDATLRSVVRVGRALAVIGLDSADPDSGAGRLDLGDQPAWLDRQLRTVALEGRDAIVAFHHPLLIGQGVAADRGAQAVLDVLARHGHVRLVLHGHTHANVVRAHPTTGGRLPFLENGAIKEYPAGYALLRVHEDGIMRTFHRPDNAWSRHWTATSARQVWGLHPSITRGDLHSRAFVIGYASRIGPGPVRGAETPPATDGPRRPRLDVDVDRSAPLDRVRRRGLTVAVHVDRDAQIDVRLIAGLGRRDGLRAPRRIVVARARRRTIAGTVRLRLRPTALDRLLLRRVRRTLTAEVEVRVRPREGSARTLRRRVRLRHRG
ncbi:metallophosphoesterase family protein [Patulibacter defluvii]|uniref:metallophosphoesterase family protein n=1 Tax=Patulibacter defluvii TaxID=3095358 RepID=UPI002A7650CA|nr:metallophosphoesterase family protein [Patulibacter sp. DM4]